MSIAGQKPLIIDTTKPGADKQSKIISPVMPSSKDLNTALFKTWKNLPSVELADTDGPHNGFTASLGTLLSLPSANARDSMDIVLIGALVFLLVMAGETWGIGK